MNTIGTCFFVLVFLFTTFAFAKPQPLNGIINCTANRRSMHLAINNCLSAVTDKNVTSTTEMYQNDTVVDDGSGDGSGDNSTDDDSSNNDAPPEIMEFNFLLFPGSAMFGPDIAQKIQGIINIKAKLFGYLKFFNYLIFNYLKKNNMKVKC